MDRGRFARLIEGESLYSKEVSTLFFSSSLLLSSAESSDHTRDRNPLSYQTISRSYETTRRWYRIISRAYEPISSSVRSVVIGSWYETMTRLCQSICHTHSHTNSLTHTRTHTLTLTQSHTHTLTHPHIHTPTHSHSPTHSHTHTLTHSHRWQMLASGPQHNTPAPKPASHV